MSSNDRHIRSFRSYISDGQYSPKICSVHYIVDTATSPPRIIRARIFLQTEGQSIKQRRFVSKNLAAGIFSLADINLDTNDILNHVVSGTIPTPDGPIKLYPIAHSSPQYSVYWDPIHEAGVSNQVRISVLSIKGEEFGDFDLDRNIQWELRAAVEPFDTFNELANDFLLAGPSNGSSFVEFVAFQTVRIIPHLSTVKNGIATLSIAMAEGLNPAKFRLGVRQDISGAITRFSINGTDFDWQTLDNQLVGTATINIDEQAYLQCFATYNDVSHGFYWVYDQTRSKNSRMGAYRSLDPSLEKLTQLLLIPDKRKGGASDFEKAAQWLFWLLGFSPVLLDTQSGLNEAPDMILATPSGHLVVVECTTGNLKAGHKIAYLVERTEKVRQTLTSSGQPHIRVLPLMITSLPPDQIRIDLPGANNAGIVVIHSDEIEKLLHDIGFPVDPESKFNEWLANVSGEANLQI